MHLYPMRVQLPTDKSNFQMHRLKQFLNENFILKLAL